MNESVILIALLILIIIGSYIWMSSNKFDCPEFIDIMDNVHTDERCPYYDDEREQCSTCKKRYN